jgi:mannosyltransferase OCH1-like enzyme
MVHHHETKKIHQIWLQGEDNLPPKYKEYMEKYKELNGPDGWEYKLWNEQEIRDLIKAKYPHLLCIYDNYPFWVMRVDLGKYCILEAEGGLLIDMDTKPLKPFNDIMRTALGKPAVIYYPHKGGFRSHFHFFENLFVHRITNNNFLYAPHPHHKFIQFLLKRAECMAERMPWDFKLYYVIGSIGPLFLIDAIEEYGQNKIKWIPEADMRHYFVDEQANSWNKKHYDSHDVVWGIIFLVLIISAIVCVYKSKK